MKKRTAGAILAIAMTLCVLLCMALPVSAFVQPELSLRSSGVGSVTVNLPEFGAGTGLGIVDVGAYENGSYVLSEGYSGLGADMTGLDEASKAQAAADILSAAAKNDESAVIVQAGEDGKAVFGGLSLDSRVYVIFQVNGEEVITVSSMLVVLPYVDVDGHQFTDLSIDAKYEDNRVEEETGAFILKKTDPKGAALSGAVFRLEVKNYVEDEARPESEELFTDDAGEYYWRVVSEKLTTDKAGQIAVQGLPFGSYRLIETAAPDGYILDSAPVSAEITSKATVKIEDNVYVADEGTPVMLTVINNPVDISAPEISIPESSTEISVLPPESSTPQPSNPPTYTGDSASKYIIVGVVVGVSLIVVILLVVISLKKKKNKDDDDE